MSKDTNNQAFNEEKEAQSSAKIPLNNTNFPILVFKGTAAYKFIVESANGLGFHPDLLAPSVISCCATCLGKKIKLKVKTGHTEPAIFYIVIVGPSGTAKTPAMKHCLSYLLKIDIEAIINSKNPTTRCTQDFTIEGILKHLAKKDSDGLLIYGDEMSSVIGSMGQYKNDASSDESFFLKAWSGGSYSKDRASAERNAHVDDICINIVMNSPPETIDKVTENDRLSSGFFSRFLFEAPKDLKAPRYDFSKDLDPDVAAEFHAMCARIDQMKGMFQLDDAAKRLYQKYDKEVKDQIDRIVDNTTRAVLSKSTNYALRFSMLFASMRIASKQDKDQGLIVTADDMKRAITVMRYYNHQNDKIRLQMMADEVPDDVKSWTNEKKKELVLSLARNGRLKNHKTVAKNLGVSRSTIYRWITNSDKTE